jgi:cytochrome c peroxidase
MSAAAKRGQKLFQGKAKCMRCHNGAYKSDGMPHNTGVPENMEMFNNPMRHMTYRSIVTNHGVPKADIWRRDVGYFLVSKDYADVGKFITPTLRELTYTAPYMHNGTIATLEDVVAFYDQGGGSDDPLARELTPLGLTDSEKRDLVAFLESLSSVTPVTVEKIPVPQKYQPIDKWVQLHN